MSDPLAEFLEREKNEFAEFDVDEFQSELTHNTESAMNGFESGPTNGFSENSDQLLDDAPGAPPFANPIALSASNIPQRPGVTPPIFSAHTTAQNRPEPETIRKWREEQKSRLENKDAQEEKEKEKWRAQAKKELEEWCKNRSEQLEKSKKSNKVSEQEFLKIRDSDIPGQEWDRISSLCEFNPKQTKVTKDVSRMRSLILQMKNSKATTE